MSIKVIANAGNHDRKLCPVSFILSRQTLLKKNLEPFILLDETGSEVPFQLTDGGEQLTLRLEPGKGNYDTKDGVQLNQQDAKVDIAIQGQYYTSYVFDKQYAKPT